MLTVVTAPVFTILGLYPFRFIWGIRFSIVVIGYFLFMWFKNMKLYASSLVKSVGKATFGVYLFHNGALLPILESIFHIDDDLYSSILWIPTIVFSAIIIMLIGWILDVLREKTFERIVMKYLTRLSEKINQKVREYM